MVVALEEGDLHPWLSCSLVHLDLAPKEHETLLHGMHHPGNANGTLLYPKMHVHPSKQVLTPNDTGQPACITPKQILVFRSREKAHPVHEAKELQSMQEERQSLSWSSTMHFASCAYSPICSSNRIAAQL